MRHLYSRPAELCLKTNKKKKRLGKKTTKARSSQSFFFLKHLFLFFLRNVVIIKREEELKGSQLRSKRFSYARGKIQKPAHSSGLYYVWRVRRVELDWFEKKTLLALNFEIFVSLLLYTLWWVIITLSCIGSCNWPKFENLFFRLSF